MGKKGAEEAQVDATGSQPAGGFTPSPTLAALLGRLSAQQAQGVIRVVEAELAGVSIEALFEGENAICSRSTYYHKARGGWIHKPAFQEALAQARQEMRAHRLTHIVDDAIAELKMTTPLAARDLRRQIVGDEDAVAALARMLLDNKAAVSDRVDAALALGAIGTGRASEALVTALEMLADEKPHAESVKVGEQAFGGVRPAVVRALGLSAQGVNPQRRLASMAVLDRASKDTADKSGGSGHGVVVYIPDNERDDEDGNQDTGGSADAVPGE